MTLTARAVFLSFTVVLAGCASYGPGALQPGASADEVRAKMGAPTGTWRDGAGDVLEYARGPEGVDTYLVQLDGAGRVSEIRQVLNEKYFSRIEIGKSTEDDVRHLIGRPGNKGALRQGEEWWDYRYFNGMMKMRLYVTFDGNHRVRELFRTQDPTEIGPGSPSSM
jgi:outer membrane protein assembly factor BamE (lipoprotein component of BamABCDE complex)